MRVTAGPPNPNVIVTGSEKIHKVSHCWVDYVISASQAYSLFPATWDSHPSRRLSVPAIAVTVTVIATVAAAAAAAARTLVAVQP